MLCLGASIAGDDQLTCDVYSYNIEPSEEPSRMLGLDDAVGVGGWQATRTITDGKGFVKIALIVVTRTREALCIGAPGRTARHAGKT
jgi:hypothetical protein